MLWDKNPLELRISSVARQRVKVPQSNEPSGAGDEGISFSSSAGCGRMTFQATPRELAFSSGHNNNFKGAAQSGTEKRLIVPRRFPPDGQRS